MLKPWRYIASSKRERYKEDARGSWYWRSRRIISKLWYRNMHSELSKMLREKVLRNTE